MFSYFQAEKTAALAEAMFHLQSLPGVINIVKLAAKDVTNWIYPEGSDTGKFGQRDLKSARNLKI